MASGKYTEAYPFTSDDKKNNPYIIEIKSVIRSGEHFYFINDTLHFVSECILTDKETNTCREFRTVKILGKDSS